MIWQQINGPQLTITSISLVCVETTMTSLWGFEIENTNDDNNSSILVYKLKTLYAHVFGNNNEFRQTRRCDVRHFYFDTLCWMGVTRPIFNFYEPAPIIIMTLQHHVIISNRYYGLESVYNGKSISICLFILQKLQRKKI